MIVLVMVAFASAALLAFMEKAGNDLLVETREADARRLRLEAYSALETTLAVLEDFRLVNNGLRSPAEGWSDPLAFAGYEPAKGRTVEVAFEDESGKLSLPTLEATALTQLFVDWGLVKRDAETLTDALLGWMKTDYVPATSSAPQPEDYERAEVPYAPPGRSMRAYSELASIRVARETFYDEKGRPNELWQRFHDAISLFRFTQPNLNAARVDVLSALGGYDLSQQQRLADFLAGKGDRARQGPGFFKSTDDAAVLLGGQKGPGQFGVEIRALRIRVTVRQGPAHFELSVVVAPPGGATLVTAVAPPGKRRGAGGGGQPTPTPTRPPAANARTREGESAPGQDSAKKLNYPFTLLEISENVVMSSSPPPETVK